MRGRSVWGLLLCLVLLFTFAAPAFAGDRDVDLKRDLRGISPKRHRYIFSVLGGAAVGAGIGALLPGGGTSMLKGTLVGSGAASGYYLMTHRDRSGLHDWGMIFSNTALGAGIGWTICDCDDGLVAGTLIGAGATAGYEAIGGFPPRSARTANPQQP